MTITAVVHLHANEDKVEQALAACNSMKKYCLSLNICTRFDVLQSREDKTHLIFIEEWNSIADHNDFLTTLMETERYNEMTGLFVSGPVIEYFEVK